MPARRPLSIVFALLWLGGAGTSAIAEQVPNADLGELVKEHTAHPAHGTEGLVAIPFEITNTGETPLSCEAKFAHWYSLTLGTAAFGVTVSTTFWSDPKTGAVAMMNAVGDQVAVERIWCGAEGRDWETRFEMPLLRHAGETEAPMRFDCAAQPEAASSAITCTAR